MPRYNVDGSEPTPAANTSAILTERGASKRHFWHYFTVGTVGTQEDTSDDMRVRRFTGTAPVGTAANPDPVDSADGAAVTTGLEILTTEPGTKGTTLLRFAKNARATFQWYADQARPLAVPDTADAGLIIEWVVANVTIPVVSSVQLEE